MKLVIFDCDGTIVDSQNNIVTAMTYAFEASGLKPPTRSAILGIVGLSLPEVFEVLASESTPATQRVLADNYRDAFTQIVHKIDQTEPLFEGAREVIEQLHARDDIILGIATGKSLRGVERLFEHQGFGPCFATVQTADGHPSKPHPAMIEQAMRDVGATPERTVMIGDTTYDIEMAVNAGASALGVEWGYHPSEWLLEAGATLISDSYADVIGHVDQLFAAKGARE